VEKTHSARSKRLAGFIRGKTSNALSQARLVGSIAADEDLLDATGLARADFDRGPGDSQAPGQELDAHCVGRASDRRRGEFHLEGVAEQADDLVPGGPRLNADFKGQARRVVLDGEHKNGSRRTVHGAGLKEKNNALDFYLASAVCPDPFTVNSPNAIDSTGSIEATDTTDAIDPQIPRLRPS
jgi:hypothetical protein